MKYIKRFQTVQERQECTDTYKYVSYTEEDKVVNIHEEPSFFCKLTLNNGEVVEIEGSGALAQRMLSQYKSTTVNAEIGNLCTGIASNAFMDYTSLTSVIIGNSVTRIGNYVFDGCTSLSSVIIGNSVTQIDLGVFGDCSSLTSVIIGNSVTSIGTEVFYGCTSLSSITIPNSVTSIGSSVFYGCSGLTSVTIGNSVTSIGNYAFTDCTSLSSITSLATTAPTIQSDTFTDVKTNGTLYVPIGSSGYDAWLTALGSGWTKVEQ